MHMSQIETIMLFALGFILAALIAMFLGRGLWNYGVKIGQKRMEKQSPLSLTEIQADRDRLRAEYAVMTRKLELRLDDLKDRMAEQMAEVSRNKTRIEKLHGEIEERDRLLAEKEEALNAVRTNMSPLESELATRTAAIQQLKEQLRNKSEVAENAERENVQLKMQLEERQTASTELEGKVAVLQEQVRSEAELSSTEKALNEKFAHLSKLTETIEQHKVSLTSQQDVIRTLTSTVEEGEAGKALKEAAEGAKKLSVASTTLEKSLGEAEKEAQKLNEELAELDKVWESRKASRAASAKPKAKQTPRKSATVTPLRPPTKGDEASKAGEPKPDQAKPDAPANQQEAESASKNDDAPEKKKKTGKSVAAKMMAAARKNQKAKAAPEEVKQPETSEDQGKPEDAAAEMETVVEEAQTGTGGKKVLSLAQRIRALQSEISK